MQGRYSHARQAKRARREQKKLWFYLGRVVRDIERKCQESGSLLTTMLQRAKRIFTQKRDDKNKLYSMQAPIDKGKVRNPFYLDSESGFDWAVISLFSSCRCFECVVSSSPAL
jgi:IS5 family transposase